MIRGKKREKNDERKRIKHKNRLNCEVFSSRYAASLNEELCKFHSHLVRDVHTLTVYSKIKRNGVDSQACNQYYWDRL